MKKQILILLSILFYTGAHSQTVKLKQLEASPSPSMVIITNGAGTATYIGTSGSGDVVRTSTLSGYLKDINGKLVAGANTTLTGSGTAASPYTIAAGSGGGGGGGGGSLPLNEIGYGTGSGITSDATFVRNPTTGQLLMGNPNTVLPFSNYSLDSESFLVIARTTNSLTNSNAHGFVDATKFFRASNNYAYNSYRNNVSFLGSATYDHYSFLEDNLSVEGTCVLNTPYSLYSHLSIASGASVGSRVGFTFVDYSGSGTCGAQTAIYIPTLSKASQNYAIDIQGNDMRTKGNIRLVGTSGSAGALTPELNFYHANTTKTDKIRSQLNANSTELQFWVSQNSLAADFNILRMDGDNGGGTGIGASILTPAKVRIGSASVYPSADLDVTGTMSVSSTFMTSKGISAVTGDAATINAITGRFRKDNSGTTFTLTNSFITANSIIILQVVTTGITSGYSPKPVSGSGSAVITFETNGIAAAPSADCDVNFWIIN